MPCEHENFDVMANIGRLTPAPGVPVPMRFQADIRIVCRDCGEPFRFIGLPAGVDLNGASVSIDGTEGRFAIAPRSQVLVPLHDRECGGFTMRRK